MNEYSNNYEVTNKSIDIEAVKTKPGTQPRSK